MKWLYFYIVLILLAILSVSMCSFAFAANVRGEFTACFTQEAQEEYTKLVELQYRDRDTSRASLGCISDEFAGITGKVVNQYMRGNTCYQVKEFKALWSKSGKVTPPQQMWVTAFFRCEADSA